MTMSPDQERKKEIAQSPFEKILKLKQEEKKHQSIPKQTKETLDWKETKKAITMPNYFSMIDKNIIKGFRGHGTIVFGKPIIEGNFMLSIKIIDPHTQNWGVRIGCCPHNFNRNEPLGCKGSVGYKSLDGGIVTQNKMRTNFVSFGVDDVMKVGLDIAPPHKHSNPAKLNYGSKIVFWKNGSMIGEWSSLYQTFYTLAASLFNQAEVQILFDTHEGFLDWRKSQNQIILYDNAEIKRLFY